MKKTWTAITILIFILFFQSCQDKTDSSAGKDGWITGNTQDKFETVADQLRGFDMAMVETGYRYQELYWSGQDQNWEYSSYQLKKIKLTIENGLERRPKRAKSAENFLTQILSEMQKSIDSKDTALFNKSFISLTNSCNSCHVMENVSSFYVAIPNNRISPIKLQSEEEK
jgi:hypothetical protein